MAEACDECTRNCNLMHKMDKNPSSVVSSFFRIMYGDDHTKVLLLPRRFARRFQNLVGEETQLEDFNGEKLTVTLTNIDGLLALQDGWDKFYLDHGLQEGDILVFHYIIGSHFTVSMYGRSGCPENRHYGNTRHQKGKKVRKERNSVNGCPEIGHLKLNERKKKRIRTKENCIDNGHRPSKIASCSRSKTSVSDQEMSPSEPLVTNKSPSHCLDNDIMVCEAPEPSAKVVRETPEPSAKVVREAPEPSAKVVRETPEPSAKVVREASEPSAKVVREASEPFARVVGETPEPFAKVVREGPSPFVVEPFCLFERDAGKVEEEYRSCCLYDLSSFEIPKNKSDAVDFSVEIRNNEFGNLESRFDEPGKNRKNEPVRRSTEGRTATPPSFTKFDFPVTKAKVTKKEPTSASETDTSDERPGNIKSMGVTKKQVTETRGSDIANKTSYAKKMEITKKERGGTSNKNDMLERSRVAMPKLTKKEPISASDTEASDERLGSRSRGTNANIHKYLTSLKKETFDFQVVKEEMIDFDEAPPPYVANVSYRVVMKRYEYLELPKDFESYVRVRSKLKSKVILLRGGVDLRPRPVLYQKECGVSALTTGWGAFARAKGLQPGDECQLVLENAQENMFTESMFRVSVLPK